MIRAQVRVMLDGGLDVRVGHQLGDGQQIDAGHHQLAGEVVPQRVKQ